MRSLPLFLLLVVSVSVALADEARPTVLDTERQTLENYAATNMACGEWTDGCAVCARQDDKTFHCSLPGIACQPSALICRAERTDHGSKQPEPSK